MRCAEFRDRRKRTLRWFGIVVQVLGTSWFLEFAHGIGPIERFMSMPAIWVADLLRGLGWSAARCRVRLGW